MNDSEIALALQPLISLFNELGISYYICGSIASSAYGTSRATQDIDLVSDITELSVNILVDKLRSDYFIDGEMIREAIELKSSFNLIHLKTMMKLDVFILRNDLFHKMTNKRKIEDTLDKDENSIKIFLSSPEDVILSKLDWYVKGNKASEQQWRDIIGVIKVQKNNLDLQYLKQWATELKVDNLLSKAFFECGIEFL